jgi:osmoprotectant transport system permease protein
LIADRLTAVGLQARTLQSLGSTVAFDALIAGQIDCYVDYSGTVWANYMKRTDNPGAAAVLEGVKAWLRKQHGIEHIVKLGFENAYALAMTRGHAQALGIRTIDDLVPHAPELKMGADYEFFARPEWNDLTSKYPLHFEQLVTMDSTLMYQAVAESEVDVITAFSTDGRIPAFDLVLLEDPRGAFPPYEAILLLGPHAINKFEGIGHALEPLRDGIDSDAMRAANRHVDVDGGSIADAAKLVWDRMRSKNEP